jgi:asparagine synthase (glutamine-hydrolysing)
MCGICGFNWKNKELLSSMLESINHRGPDDRGTHLNNSFSIGHNRLSIIDLSEKGKNPIWNENKTICIIFNGEIYNYEELKKDFEAKGHKFKTKTDTEVILHGFEEYKEKILDKLNGMFAFAIYNLKTNEIFIARDRLGIKPLYYYFDGQNFMFASEIKAILQNKKIKRIPNYETITEYLTFQNILDEKTFFKGINILLPGNYLRFNNNNLEIKEYWKPEFKYKKRNYQELLKEFRETFKNSIKRHMTSDVPVGSYLSGGFDSASVTTLASKEIPEKINTFTCKFDIKGEFDETPCARAVAKQIGANNFEIEVTKEDFLKNIKKTIYHMDEPRVGIPVIAQYHLSELVSKHIKVVLTGHSGDELFAGYPVFQAKTYKNNLKNFLKILKDKKRLNLLYYLLLPKLYSEIKHGLIVIFPEKEKKKLLTKEFLKKTKNYNPHKAIKKVIGNENLTEIEKLQYLYLKTYLPGLFIAEDKMGMAHSIEARIPFCDNEMVDFALSIPIQQKLKNNELKGIIKNGMKGIIPKILYEQEKRGFPTPLNHWLKNGLDKYFEEILLSKEALSRRIYKRKEVKKLLKKRDFWSINKLWCLLNIELWFREFITS